MRVTYARKEYEIFEVTLKKGNHFQSATHWWAAFSGINWKIQILNIAPKKAL